MTGELIATGITYGVGRIALNNAFSGTAEFNNVMLDSGANFSAGTGGGILYSGGTDLYDIFGSGGGGSSTASNGLTKTGDNITLGGTLTASTSIITDSNEFLIDAGSLGKFVLSGDSASDGQIIIANYNLNRNTSLIVEGGKTTLNGANSAGTISSLVQATAGTTPGAIVQIFNGLATSSLLIQESDMTISDNINEKGFVYNGNYHANYDNRTLVDKEYVDNTAASAQTVSPTFDYGTVGASLDWNVSSQSPNGKVILSANTTLNVINATSGMFGTLEVVQNGTGGYSISLGAGTHKVVNGGSGTIRLTAAANAVDVISFFYDGSQFLWTVGNDYT